MPSNRRIRGDDFDIESIETMHGRARYKSRSSGPRTRSRSRKRSYSRRLDNGSRSRSRSIERRRHRRGRYSSRSHSRSRSRDNYRRPDIRNKVSRKYQDSRSRSRSRSRSDSRHQSERFRHRRVDYEERRKKNSRSRSRSRSSSHFRDFGSKLPESEYQLPSKPSTSSSSPLESFPEENNYFKNTFENIEDLPLPEQKSEGIYHFDENEPIDRARIHREMEEKLRATLAKEGKVYPPPKPEASHPVFANDGSFLEIFKKMQEAQASTSTSAVASSANNLKPTLPSVPSIVATANPSTAPYLAAAATGKSAPPPPIVGRRRGGKILKTGVVAKPKIQADANADPKDFWSLYLAEVNKYKNTACESEQGNRPLVK